MPGRKRGVERLRRWSLPLLGVSACLACTPPAAGVVPVSVSPVASPADTVPRHVRSSLSPYRDHPGVADVRRVLLKWSPDGGPRTATDSVAVAVLWRRAGQYRTALEALPSEHGADGTHRPRVTLERARILLQAPQSGPGIPGSFDERRVEGGEAFWRACADMDEPTKRAFWEDLRGLSTPDEQAEWAELGHGSAACDWMRKFVDERAFRMAVSAEERLQIHYSRLYEARALYYLRTPRLTDDLADRLGRADSLEIDDRGLIYLRMGWPLATVEPFMDLNETWAYHRPEGPRVFHFAPISKTGLRALADYRLLENLADASGFTMPSEQMGRGGSRFAYLYQARRVLDFLYEGPHFHNMDSRMRAAGDRFNPGFQGFLAWERDLNEADARYAVSGVPDAPDLTAGIEFAYETLRFREPGTDRSEVWFLAATRVGDLTAHAAVDPSTDVDGLVGYDIGAELVYMAPGGMRRSDLILRPLFDDPLADDDGIPVRFPVTLTPETYPYVLVLRDAGSERGNIGNWVLDTVTVSARQFGVPSVSDIAVAADSGGSWSRDGTSFLRIGPTHVVSADGTAHMYFEVYGIRPTTTYDVEVRVVPEEAADMAFDLGPENLAFAVRFPSVAAADRAGLGIGRHYLRVELGQSEPGAYLLAVRVIDRSTGIESLPAVTPLYRPEIRDAHWSDAPRRRSTIVNP
jgi:hypothetical protein